MNILQAILLGLVQGLTEFIPVSSSGHLVIMERLLNIQTGLVFDVALHIGTLTALLSFFWRDILKIAKAVFVKSPQTKLAWLIVLATVPAVIVGFFLQDLVESSFRSLKLVGLTLIGMASFMILAEYFVKRKPARHKLEKLTPAKAAFIGSAQALAIVPGISRSGSTIVAGIFSGLDRVSATRLSFLLAIPITTGAILKVLIDSEATTLISQRPAIFAAGILSAALSGMFAIKFLLNYLAKNGLHIFAYYRIALGLTTLLVL